MPHIPYELTLLIAALMLAGRYTAIKGASIRSKWLVGGGAAASVFVPAYLPTGALAAALLQLAVSAYVLLYLKATPEQGT